MSEQSRISAVDRFLEIISSARERPEMYFDPIGPIALIHWLHGLRTGLYDWGGAWPSSEHREAPLAARGLEYLADWETKQLEERGLTPAEIVDELLAIEIEEWQSYRASLSREAP